MVLLSLVAKVGMNRGANGSMVGMRRLLSSSDDGLGRESIISTAPTGSTPDIISIPVAVGP